MSHFYNLWKPHLCKLDNIILTSQQNFKQFDLEFNMLTYCSIVNRKLYEVKKWQLLQANVVVFLP